jgi:DNA polymerase-3 subunit gamma/tau
LVDLETLNETMLAIGDQDAARLLRLMDDIVSRGYDLRNFSRELMTHIRGLLVVKVTGFDAELVQMPASEGEALTRLAELFSEQDLLRFFSILTKTEQDIRVSSQPRFQLEMGLMKMLHSRRLFLLEDALRQLEEISAKLGGSGLGSALSGGKSTPGPSAPRQSMSNRSVSSNLRTPAAFADVVMPPAPSTNKPPTVSPQAKVQETVKPATVRPPAPPVEKPISTPKPLAPPPWEEEPAAHDDPFDSEPEAPSQDYAVGATAGEHHIIERFKHLLEEKKKMMLLSVINLADHIHIKGDTVEIAYQASQGIYKNQVTSRDNKRLIEEICHDLLGRPVTLVVTVGEQPTADPQETETKPKRAANQKPSADSHPKLRAIADKFKGQVVDIIAPENKS